MAAASRRPQRHELPVAALVRDIVRGERLLPGVELVRGDLDQPASLAAALRDIPCPPDVSVRAVFGEQVPAGDSGTAGFRPLR